MRYNQRQFLRLIEAIEAEGGEHLDDLCVAREYEFVGDIPVPQGNVVAGCGHMALFMVPVEDGDPIKLCGVCDGLGATPRFAGVMSG